MNNPGTLVIAPIRPQDSADTYPVALSNEIAGGWHQVQSLADRDTIPEERRIEGMVCYVLDVATYYVLKGGLTNDFWQTNGASALTGRLGIPTDGQYGVNGNTVTGILSGDLVEDAFDKVETILEKLAPAKPVSMSAVQLAVVNGYSAIETATGTLRTSVIDSTLPVIQTPQSVSSGVWDGTTGILTAYIDTTPVGSRTLTSADDSGTYGIMTITFDTDYYLGVSGKQNFWWALGIKIIPSVALSTGAHLFQLVHSTTGTTSLTVYIDDLLTPTVTTPVAAGSGTPRYISGVPSMASGQSINVTATINNAVRSFYNPTKIAQVSGNAINTITVAPPAGLTFGASYSVNQNAVVASNAYTEHTTITITGYNSKGTPGSNSTISNIRVDTISNETTRKTSGTGQYPLTGYGNTYDSTQLLSANEELQLLGGVYKYPPAVSYTSNVPTVGPNYTALAPGSYANLRWVTFALGTISGASSITLTFQGASNIVSLLQANFALYVRVNGSSPTAGWIDGNAAYPGVGSPNNDGDAALDYGNSSPTVRRITFGTNIHTGTVYARIGIRSSSNISFTGVTLS